MRLILSYIIFGVIGIAFLCPAFADQYYRGEDFSVRENPDGSMTRTIGLPTWVYDGEHFVPQIVNDYDTHIKIESGYASFIYDKDSCSISIYAPGRIGEPIYDDEGNVIDYSNSEPIIQSESWSTKKADVGSDVWRDVSWNDVHCVTSFINNSTGVYISGKHETMDGWTQVTYAKPTEGPLETFTTVKNNQLFDTSKYGTDQVVILGDQVSKTVNEDANKIIFEKDGQQISMDYTEAEKELWTVNQKEDSIHLDYKNPVEPLSFGQTQTLDPVWNGMVGDFAVVQSTNSVGTSCGSGSSTSLAVGSGPVYKEDSASNGSCDVVIFYFTAADLDVMPDKVTVTDTVLGYNVSGVASAVNCDYVPVTHNVESASAATLWTDVTTSTPYVSNDSTCTTTGSKTEDLGATADTNLQSAINNNSFFEVGLKFNSMTRDGSDRQVQIDDSSVRVTLSITYTMLSPDPPKLVNATMTGPPYQVDLAWSTPEGNGGGVPSTATIERLSLSDVWEELDTVTMSDHAYTDTNPIQNNTAYYRVYSTNAQGDSAPQFAMTPTITTNLKSYWPLISSTNDNGIEDNDGTVTGLESYDTTGQYFNGTSYDTIPNESDYDYDRTDDFSLCLTAKWTNTGVMSFISKLNSTSPNKGWELGQGSTNKIRLSLISNAAGNIIQVDTPLSYNDGSNHRICVGYPGDSVASNITMYVDNSQVTPTVIQNTLSASILNNKAVYLGTRDAGSVKLTGSLGDVMILNNFITDQEVDQDYQHYIITEDDMAYGTYTLTNEGTLGDTPKLVTYLNVTAGFPDDITFTETIFVNNTDIDQTITTETVPFEWAETYWPQMTQPDATYNYEAQINLDNNFETEDETSNTVSSAQEFDPSYLPALDNPSVQGNVNYTISRSEDSDTIYLGVNREGGTLTRTWNIECITQNNLQASQSKDPNTSWEGTWTNLTNVGYFNSSWTGFANSQGYVTCFNEDRLFTGISYTNSSLALLGIQLFDESYGSMLGVPVGIFFIVITAGMANKRTAPTWIIVLAAIAGMMAVIGFFTLSPIVWGVALVAAMLGVFVNQKVF